MGLIASRGGGGGGGGLVPVFLRTHSKQLKASHHQSVTETPLKWRFADGSMVAQYCGGLDQYF